MQTKLMYTLFYDLTIGCSSIVGPTSHCIVLTTTHSAAAQAIETWVFPVVSLTFLATRFAVFRSLSVCVVPR